MPDNVLYFPYIRVPQNSWFTRILLYWDTVGSIVPYEYLNKPASLGKYMRALVSEGLVKQIIPGQYIYSVPNFLSPFLSVAQKRLEELGNSKIDIDSIPTYRIHIEKIEEIAEELCKMGLAKISEYPWYEVEQELALKFMAYLASVLGNLKEINSRPITDAVTNLDIFSTPYTTRSIVLDKLLPAPTDNVNVSKIVDFKANHQKQLKTFRNEIESFLIQYNNLQDEICKKDLFDRYISNAQDKISELTEAMKDNGWTNISFGRFITYSITGLTLADAIATGGLFSIIASAFGVVGSGYSTYKENKDSSEILNSNFVYASLATKVFPNA